jgi:type IV pilus assembly protein PilF
MRTARRLCAAAVLAIAGCATGHHPSPSAPSATGAADTAAATPEATPDLRRCAEVPETPDTPLTERQRQARVHLGLGAGYLREGAREVALRELRQSLDLDPKVAETHGTMALLMNALGKYDEAQAAYAKALSLAPSDPEIHNNYGGFLCARGRLQEADAQFRCALANPLSATPEVAYTHAGECAARAGNASRARKDFESAVMIAPRFAQPRLRLAESLFQSGDAAAALRSYQRYAELTTPSAADLAFGVRVARAAGDEDRAASYALLLRDRYPDSAEAAALDRP